MDVTLSSWLVIALALAGANLPFFNDRVLGLIPVKAGAGFDGRPWHKPLYLRLLEMVLLYFVVGAVGFALEAQIGNVFPQTWEFYAITGCLFVVLAFPGFVLRYLRKRHHS
ncbi:MAG TPA: DUF2818 domain-containing protein [Janthinobacterium sp.]|nr:DUF2818 domain-containing protein [Janthinobacterium sp.]